MSLSLIRLRDSENVIILTIRFCKAVAGFELAGYVKPHT